MLRVNINLPSSINNICTYLALGQKEKGVSYYIDGTYIACQARRLDWIVALFAKTCRAHFFLALL